MTDDKNKLKPDPCPFCRGKRLTIKRAICSYYIYCDRCRADGPLKPTEQEAIKAWNKRAGDTK